MKHLQGIRHNDISIGGVGTGGGVRGLPPLGTPVFICFKHFLGQDFFRKYLFSSPPQEKSGTKGPKNP